MTAWLRFAVLCLLLSSTGAARAEDLAPEAFEKRWVVVLGSYADAPAAHRAAAERGAGLHILVSDTFIGLAPGYHVLVAGPFADRKEAATAARTVEPDARGYVKFTGALRGPASDREGAANKPVKPADVPERTFPVPSFLSAEQVVELEQWRRAVERTAGPGARYQILEVFESFAGAGGGIVIRERITTPGKCMQGYRELQFGAPQGGVTLRTTSLLGQNCCAGTPCPERTPGGLMLELFEGDRDLSWAIDPARGVGLDNMQGWSTHITRAQRAELEPFRAFDPKEDTFECPPDFSDGVAHCFKYAAGKGYDFVWAKRPGGPVLERIIIAHRQ